MADEFESYWSGYNYAIKKFDEQSLVISSGALALSLTFIKDIVPLDKSCCIFLFYISIVLFLATIILGFINHFISSDIHKRMYVFTLNIDDMKKNGKSADEILVKETQRYEYSEKGSGKISSINKSVAFSLVFGLLFLVSYCIINISEYREQNEKCCNCHHANQKKIKRHE